MARHEIRPDDVQVSIRIPNTLHTKLRVMAVEQEITMGQLLREALEACAQRPSPKEATR